MFWEGQFPLLGDLPDKSHWLLRDMKIFLTKREWMKHRNVERKRPGMLLRERAVPGS